MRPILLAVLGISAVALAPLGMAAGCAAGETSPSTSQSTRGAGGTGGGSTGTSTNTGGKGGTGGSAGHGGGTGGSTGGHGGTGGSTGGAGGTGGSACVPTDEVCDGFDNDCNGVIDDKPGGCSCKAGDTQPCFSGDPITKDIGVCHAGTQTCDLQGQFGPCQDEVIATAETCNGLDDDCNGTEDDNLGQTTCGQGACTVTVDNCVNGVDQVCTPGQVGNEKCNGLDDNCDGNVDEGCMCLDGDVQDCYTGSAATLGVGACHHGTQLCSTGQWGPCEGEQLPVPETCNAVDDNCDGQTDEGLGTSVCGVGACSVTVDNCVGGLPQTCVAGQPQPETCNGIDDDCNNLVDDGLGNTTCGLGECVNVVPFCQNGSPTVCVPLSASPESCDGKDNDCNGFIDDGNPGGGGPCVTGNQGVCAAGTLACTGGGLVCNQNAQPGVEVCDGQDNDCNGQSDDGNPGGGAPCNTGFKGVCAAGTTNCAGGAIMCSQNVQPGTETCDGLDNNCNGQVDEGNPGGGLVCNTGKLGLCSAGTTACSNGGVVCNQNTQPSAELCDGQDNNCDGQADEGNPGGGLPCNTGKLGVCAVGTTACTGGVIVCNQNVQPSAETCDGLDNDCDGTIDNGNPGGGASCSTGKLGVCSAGTTACTAGAVVCNQNVQPSAETCDGLDNNCNGQTDEGNPGGGAQCNTGKNGVCAAGTTACTAGSIVCNQNTQPSAETCDGLDNDCDGAIDNGNPGGGANCTTGKLGVCSAGTTACTGGAVVCNQNVQPSAEICDGLDNNCNGQADDGNPGGGASCNTGKLGVCAAGTSACTGGVIVCNQNVQPSAEICDGLDNNCNGAVDDGNPGGNQSCNTGKLGVCSAGTTACTGGAIACNQNVQPSAEVCDGLDNNCNGTVDDGNPGGGASCNTGQSGICAAGTSACTGGTIVCNRNQNPSAETCDGLDNDCNGAVDDGNPGGGQSCNTGKQGVCSAGTTACTGGAIACNQNVQPSAEICDGLDNNCNGAVDDGNPGGGASCNTGLLGVCAAGTTACQSGAVKCNQNVQSSAEICDGLDNNCNGTIDEGVKNTYYLDADSDGYGNALSTQQACSPPAGYVANANDCDDTKNSVHPGAAEACNGIDDNCNGTIDEGVKNTYYRDADGDTYGNAAVTTQACSLPAGYVTNSTDCDDTKAAVHPGAAETCNGVDDNCNGTIDEGVKNTYYRDADGDTYGNAAVTTQACSLPAGYVVNSTDCDDTKAGVHPGAAEVCNGIDDDCNGTIDNGNPGGGAACNTGLAGICAAGTTACQGGVVKCNQNQNPQTEVCDGVDNDCNGAVDLNAFSPDGIPNSCGAAGGKVLTVQPGGTANATGIVDPSGDDYFVVTFANVPGPGFYYHPKIELTTNPGGQYTMYLENACGSGAWCGGAKNTLEMSFPDDPTCRTYGVCQDIGQSRYTTWIVRVTRTSYPTTCQPYTVTASNQ